MPDLLPQERIDTLVDRTANGGAEIVNLLKSGGAYYAPSASVLAMVDSIDLDQKRILPCSTYLQGEYGFTGLFLGVPVKLGAGGAEEVVEIELTQPEKDALARSADSVRELLAVMERTSGAGATGS